MPIFVSQYRSCVVKIANVYIGYVHLSDVVDDAEGWSDKFRRSKWFTRGWTLQELIAPQAVEFYANNWAAVGTKLQRVDEIHEITGIPNEVLISGECFSQNAAERFCWVAHRQLSRAEDSAYSLLGLFDIHMPMLYGEGGKNAFRRLQQEIFKRSADHTIFLYTTYRGLYPQLLADSVAQYCQTMQCAVCPRNWRALFPKYVPYQSLQIIPLRKYTQILGPSRVHQELVYDNRWNVLAPLRIAMLKFQEESLHVEKLGIGNDDFTNGAAILRVSDNGGRWICIGLRGPKSNPYDHALMRNTRISFVEEKNIQVLVDEQLVSVFNSSSDSQNNLPKTEFLITVDSPYFDLVQFRVRFPEQDIEWMQKGNRYDVEIGHRTSQTVFLPMVYHRYSPGDRELVVYTKFNGQDQPAIFVAIVVRNLVYNSVPYIHAECLTGNFDGHISTPDYDIKSDRCLLHLAGGLRVQISLRRKPGLSTDSPKARRYNITMTLEE